MTTRDRMSSFKHKTLGTIATICLAATVGLGLPASAHADVRIEVSGNERCFIGDGLPDHSVGQFPNRGNPHSLRTQRVRLCVPTNPTKGSARNFNGSIGIALNGVQIRPGTADYYDPSSPRGHSRDRSSGWNLEGIGARNMLGMDNNDAHVDERGLYHYHGLSNTLKRASQGTLIGYAADGFEIHYVPGQSSSWRLKSGTRPSGPGGRYDGTYVEDYEFIQGAGTLDRCNGGMLNGRFVYFATDTFPFFPRCLYGRPARGFAVRG